MAAFLVDAFTDTAGTDLAAHTPGTGGAWSIHPASAVVIDVTDANRVMADFGTGAGWYTNAAAPPSADYYAECVVKVVTIAAHGSAGPVVRCDTVANTKYWLHHYAGDQTWYLQKSLAGSVSTLGTWGETLADGDTRTARLQASGTAITAYIGGVSRIAVTDSAISSAGKAGVFCYAEVTPDYAIGTHLDSVTADALGGGDTTPPTVSSTSPASGATGVALAVHPTVTLSEAPAGATVTTSTVRVKLAGTPVAGSVALVGNVVTITPTSALAPSTTYTIEVTTGLTDVAGNALASTFTSTFTTTSGTAATLGYDYFNGTDGALASARPTSGGDTWVAEAGDLVLSGNRATWPGGSSARLIYQHTPTAAEYDIYVEVYPAAADGTPVIYARWASGTGYSFAIDPVRRRIEFYASGVFFAASSDNTVPLTVGQITLVKVQVRDAAKKVFVGVGAYSTNPTLTEIFSSADNSVTQVGQAGIGTNNGSGLAFETFILGEPDFVFAPDTTAPVVTKGTVTTYAGQTSARADINATASENAQFRVRWGTSVGVYTGGTTAYGAFVASGTATIAVTGLPGGATIHYVVDALDAAGNAGTSSAGSFAAPANDTTAPTIGPVTVTPAADGSSLGFAFSTNEGANATVQVGTASGVYTLSASDSAYPTSHNISVAGTVSGTSYFYRVVATDAAGNVTTGTQASYTNPGVNATTATLLRISVGANTILAELRFVGDDNKSLVVTQRYKASASGTWRTNTVNLELQDRLAGEPGTPGRMAVGFLANLAEATAHDLELTLTDADGVTVAGVAYHLNEVAQSAPTITNTSGTVKKLTVTGLTTGSSATPSVGSITHYLSPSGNDTTGDGSSGTPWQTLNKAATALTTGTPVVRLAAGAYTPLTVVPVVPMTFVAQNPATTVSDVTRSGRTRKKPVPANAGSRARIEPSIMYTPTGSGLPNAGQWTSVNLVGPAGTGTYATWKLTGVPTTKVGTVMRAAVRTDDPIAVPLWDLKSGSYTVPSGTYAGKTFLMTTPAGWREVVAVNDQYRYGAAMFVGAGVTDIYAVLPAGVDPNDQYCWIDVTDAESAILGTGLRFSGIEFRQHGVRVGETSSGTIFDACLFRSAIVNLAGDKAAGTRGKNCAIYDCLSTGSLIYSSDGAQLLQLLPWNWIKTGVIIGGFYTGWSKSGQFNETTAFQTSGGVHRAALYRCAIDGWFNGFGGFNSGWDRFTMYHNVLQDVWFEHIGDDALEPEQTVMGLLVIRPIIADCMVAISVAPANCGPILVQGSEIVNLTFNGFGVDCSADGLGTGSVRGGALVGIKIGVGNDVAPHLYWWHNTAFADDAEANGALVTNGGSGSQRGPYFHYRNNIGRWTRYIAQVGADADDDYNDWTTTDAARGVNVNSSNQTNIVAYRASLTGPAGRAAHTNLRADFHTLVDGELVDAVGADFRLRAGSALLDAGIAVPYWDVAGTDFVNAAPNLGAVQSFVAPPADTTPPTVVSTTPAAGAAQVAVATSPTVTFSEAMDGATITTSTVRVKVAGSPVAAVVTYDAPTRTATINPTINLGFSTACTIEVTTGVTDSAGNALAATFTATFTTIASPDATPPTVVGVAPSAGATGLPVDTIVTVTVSEALDPASVTSSTVRLLVGGVPVAATRGYTAGGTSITLSPTAALAYNTAYVVSVAGITDVAGNALAAPFSAGFTTATSAAPGLGTPGLGTVSLAVNWASATATTTQLAYGPTAALGSLTTLDTAYVTSHTATIAGVTPGARLYVKALGVTAQGIAEESAVVALTVPGKRHGGLLRI